MGEILRFVPVPIGGEVRAPNGGRIRVEYEDPSIAKRDNVIVAEKTAHERDHGLGAELTGTEVILIDLNPGPGYEAITHVAEPNPVAAAASFGNGHNGSFKDRLIVLGMGLDPDSMGHVARSVVEGAPEEREETGRMLEVERVATGKMFRDAMKDGKEGRRVIVLFKDREGNKKKEIKTRVKGQIAMVPDTDYELPQAA